jgi:hypothetical protein
MFTNGTLLAVSISFELMKSMPALIPMSAVDDLFDHPDDVSNASGHRVADPGEHAPMASATPEKIPEMNPGDLGHDPGDEPEDRVPHPGDHAEDDAEMRSPRMAPVNTRPP